MSDPTVKGIKRSPARPVSRRSASTTSKRTGAAKSARPKPISKREPAVKAPAKKASKSVASKSVASKGAQVSKAKTAKKTSTPPSSAKRTSAKPPVKSAKKAISEKKPATAKHAKTVTSPSKAKPEPKKAVRASAPSVKSRVRAKAAPAVRPVKKATPPSSAQASRAQQKQHFIDEGAALQEFQRAYSEFAKGHFGEARDLFKALIDKYSGGSDVVARGRTYLAIAEARLRTDASLPRDADSLYDRGVIELNRGEFVAAQEMFERALKQEPQGAHIHYGLAASRARLGSLEAAMDSLKQALNIQPNLRVRAQHDADLTALRNDPEFDRLLSHRS